MKRTCDMDIGETYVQVTAGVSKTFKIISKETTPEGFIIVNSSEVTV